MADLDCKNNSVSEGRTPAPMNELVISIKGDHITCQYNKELVDLKSILSNPELQLESFNFEQSIDGSESKDEINKGFNEFETVLKSLNHQVSTKKCEFQVASPHHLPSILSYMKSSVLEKIVIKDYGYEGVVDQLEELEQWKRAQVLGLYYNFMEFPLECATHFKRFELKFMMARADAYKKFREFFTSLPNFERCTIHVQEDYGPKHTLSFTTGRVAPNELTEYVNHWPIPDSDDYLEVMYFDKNTTIEKKKKE